MWKKEGDLAYDEQNLEETIRYCRAHNNILRDMDEGRILGEFLSRVRDSAGGFAKENLASFEGQIGNAFNAFFTIDHVPAGQYTFAGAPLPAPYAVNFFVRLGRKPALSAA